MSKKLSIMLSLFLFSIAITFIDAFVHPNYYVKIAIKILFFLALPMLFFVKNKDEFKDFKKMFVFKKTGILKALLLGVSMYTVIIGGCIFNYLNESNENIYSSWFVHMFGSFAINTVGFILFGVL